MGGDPPRKVPTAARAWPAGVSVALTDSPALRVIFRWTLLALCALFSVASAPQEAGSYLQERFLLLKVLADHRGDVIGLGIGAQLVGPPTPVLLSLVLLLQALEDTADLGAEASPRLRGMAGIGGHGFASLGGQLLSGSGHESAGPKPKTTGRKQGSILHGDTCRPFRIGTK